ncbi:hypothetical protein [Haladaptatus sp. CMAA 1911]|uniref:hypothetical protein n=1 Tax=unclassified Haladaptatus TaxID=2622732 RepID=UPI00375534FB
MEDEAVQIPPLSIKPRNESAREAMRRHFAILIGLLKVVLVGSIIQIVVLACAWALGRHVLHYSSTATGWMVILSWFLAAYFIKLYGRSIFPVNADQFTRV